MKCLGRGERPLLPLEELVFLPLAELLLLREKVLWLPLVELLVLPLGLLLFHPLLLQVVQRHLSRCLLALHHRPTASPYRLQLRRQS